MFVQPPDSNLRLLSDKFRNLTMNLTLVGKLFMSGSSTDNGSITARLLRLSSAIYCVFLLCYFSKPLVKGGGYPCSANSFSLVLLCFFSLKSSVYLAGCYPADASPQSLQSLLLLGSIASVFISWNLCIFMITFSALVQIPSVVITYFPCMCRWTFSACWVKIFLSLHSHSPFSALWLMRDSVLVGCCSVAMILFCIGDWLPMLPSTNVNVALRMLPWVVGQADQCVAVRNSRIVGIIVFFPFL